MLAVYPIDIFSAIKLSTLDIDSGDTKLFISIHKVYKILTLSVKCTFHVKKVFVFCIVFYITNIQG